MLEDTPRQSIPECFELKMVADGAVETMRREPVSEFNLARAAINLQITARLRCAQFIRRAMINPGAGSVA